VNLAEDVVDLVPDHAADQDQDEGHAAGDRAE
jgi:hypothetical protein